jgi:hypothetical protein
MPKNNEWAIPKNINKPVETVYELKKEEEIRLPKLSEITDKDGKVKLPSELIEKLRDPNARFRVDVVAFPFVDEANALIVARSQAIMSEMERDYPTVVSLLNYNRAGVIEFLKAEGGLSAIEVIHDFDVRSTSTSDDGKEVWRKYKDEIFVYVDKLCRKLTDENGRPVYQEELRPARRALGEHIYDEYYRKLPCWPAPFCENTEWVDANIGGSYRSGAFYVVWNCSGYIKVHDKNEGFSAFRARFTGSPEIRVLLVNLDFLASMERRFRGNIEGGRKFIESEQDRRRDRGVQYSWERRYLSM